MEIFSVYYEVVKLLNFDVSLFIIIIDCVCVCVHVSVEVSGFTIDQKN